jgi:Flp pilus assembly protein TadD
MIMCCQGREGEAGQALKQAQRCKLDSADLLEELGCKYMELGRLDSATDCLARAVAARDGVKVGA